MQNILLAGSWLFTLGAPDATFPPQNPPPAAAFTDTIELPGTTETRAQGVAAGWADPSGLTRVRPFVGPAWYRRTVDIPAAWAGKRVQLRLERTRFTQVWLGDRPLGDGHLYGTPQTFDLGTALPPGPHTLTILVDNRPERRPVRGQAHHFDDSAQTNWNGLLGDLSLTATDTVWLDDVQVRSDVAARTFHVTAKIGNLSGTPASGSVTVEAVSFNHDGAAHRPAPQSATFAASAGDGATVTLDLPLGADAQLWDEFSPALYALTVRLAAAPAGAANAPRFSDTRNLETGLREFRTQGQQFVINGRPTFLRGKHEAGVFPLPGHPPMDVAGWERYLRTVQEWGFNHIRCHTWMPPEAAFAAADRLGMYLQPELPFWGSFDANVRDFLRPEGEALLRALGNHPSFVMLTLGNEMGGDRALMNALVVHLRTLDPSRLYADGSNNVLWDPVFQPTNDFYVSAKSRPPADPAKTFPARGSFCVFDGADGHTQWGPAETRTDLSAALAGLPVPFVGHETGQWTVYPDFTEIPKYTGVVRAKNLERFRDRLARAGMLDQAAAFARASGAHAAELYREENELFRRTPGMAGYQHLDLQDYPGQGSALVGLLDAFMEPKSGVSAAHFRGSNGALVPLARFDKYAWTTAETYRGDLQLSHYGRTDLPAAQIAWTLTDAAGAPVRTGTLPALDLARGGLRDLGAIAVPLAGLPAPARYDLFVRVDSGATHLEQSWPVWVYPEAVDTAAPAGVVLARSYDSAARAALAAGKRVVLVPAGKFWGNTLPGAYATDYWNWPMFNNTPGTLGLLCDPNHPVLAAFPTRFHSERQWSEIAHASRPVILSATPAAFRPLVQVIDNYERNEKLGLVFETAVGSGRLLVCAVDLLDPALAAKPAARQLLASLLRYAGSDAFAPTATLDADLLDTLLRPSLAEGKPATASTSFKPPWGFVPQPLHAFDGDINTRWRPADDDAQPWIAVDLGAPAALASAEFVFGNEAPGYRYRLEGSLDGKTWQPLVEENNTSLAAARRTHTLAGQSVRHVRVVILAKPTNEPFMLRELRVVGK
ncbi:MAG TPA: discoidin domain-containing protein [Opitutaceae bacterium]|nr:discoidin domain-containing protein [Opitutaceae bacterium]